MLHGARTLKEVVSAAVLAAGLGAAAFAQESSLSDSEMAARFRAQMESIKAATDVGLTRGLVLSNGGSEAAPPAAAAPVVVSTVDPDTAPAADPAAPVVAAAEPAPVHWNLPPEEQVSVQISFSFDSSAISEAEKPKLRQVCGALGDAGVGVLRIVGHTDAAGPWGYNLKLSELRAEEVMRFFVTECGVPAERLQAVGVGEQFPFDIANPRAGVNRRVEFQAMS